MRTRIWLTTSLVLLVGTTLGLAGRFTDLNTKFQTTPDQARVVASSYLGSPGTEWLVGGGFQPDGTIVVAGVTLGPTLDLGVSATVLGTDLPAPAIFMRKQLLDKGKPKVDKQGNPILADLKWNETGVTAFVVRLSSDLKEIKSVSRLPWQSAGVTSACVDATGAIYLAGPATEALAKLPGDVQALKPSADTGTKGGTPHTYVAKLTPDASKVVWVRHLVAPSSAPDVEVTAQGHVKFQGADLRTFDANGKELNATVIPGGITGRTAINPVDGTFARYGEHKNWHTGREPYRDPVLNIHQPDGKLKYELYHWDGPLIGLDNLRLVSDSVVQQLRYDDQGNIILVAWSDGGNSVMYREPYDVRTYAKNFKGLGMSAWGANVLSCAYIIKLDGKSYQVSGGTLWLAYLKDKDKPNSVNINTLGFAGDGSVCIGGNSAWGLIQTGNAIGGGEPAGPYIAVLNADCTSLRFCSAVPACAKVDLNEGQRWGIVRGKLNGKETVLYLGSASGPEDVYGKTLPAPSVKARQEKFAGGDADGYMLLLDLAKN